LKTAAICAVINAAKAAEALLADAGLATVNLTDTALLQCKRGRAKALATSDVIAKMSAAYVDVWLY
jgi:hypothetical protein